MKEWNEPAIIDLSVINTESSVASDPVHDGVYFDTQYGKFEGHRS